MVSEKVLTFLELMRIGLIRKKIFDYISSFSDISNLAKTCKQMSFLIQSDSIKRYMLRYYDKKNIKFTVGRLSVANLDKPKLKNVIYQKDNRFSETINGIKKFFGEVILDQNRIVVEICNDIKEFRKKERKIFSKILAQKMELNRQLRKDSTILRFKRYNNDNEYIVLRALRYMGHENITRIEFPIDFFKFDIKKYKNMKSDFFRNFPKLYELVIYKPFSNNESNDFYEVIKNKNVLKRLLKSFSGRMNATLIIPEFNFDTYHDTNFIKMVFSIARKYKIKTKCHVDYSSFSIEKRTCIIDSITKCQICPVKEYITSVMDLTVTFGLFLNMIKFLKRSPNLKTLGLKFLFIDINENFEEMSKMSLKRLENMKEIKLDFSDYLHQNDVLRLQRFNNYLENLALRMPKTIEKFDLYYGFDFTTRTAKILNKYMPNIKVLVMNHVSFKDPDCLTPFKNLQAIISFNCYPIEIPSTVKLLIIGYNGNIRSDNNAFVEQELIDKYSKQFLKCLESKNHYYVFFNEIRQWDMYKYIVQDLFHL